MNWRLASAVTQEQIDAQAASGNGRWTLRQLEENDDFKYDHGVIKSGSRLFVGEFRYTRGIKGRHRAVLPIDSVCDEVEWCEAEQPSSADNEQKGDSHGR